MTRLLSLLLLLALGPAFAAQTFYVGGPHPAAADTNPGTAAKPWKTLTRAASAAELKPGDTVLIKSGVYRESPDITVAGEPGKPITFAAAPGAKVVIKGSEIVRGTWTRLADPADPNVSIADKHTWKMQLGDEYFTDPRPGFEGVYDNKATRWISQVFYQDDHPLRLIGPDRVYPNDKWYAIEQIGNTRADMIPSSFFFDTSDQTLYLNIGGDPAWYTIEVGVRAFALTVTKTHDIVVRGIEMRHNRQPGGQWPLASLSECQRVTIEDCKVSWGDFAGLSLANCRNCTVRRCEITHNGAIGCTGGLNEDCTIEDSKLMFNNYRHVGADWGVAAGLKWIPQNKRITVRRCEFAYNDMAEGIWFDTENEDIRILDNVCHHNGDCGIFFEINKGGGVIAGNLVYANTGRGIYVSGSQNTWVAHNTVIRNDQGIVCMIRAADEPPKENHVLNNLMISNYVYGDTITRGADLILETPADPAKRAEWHSSSDYNVFGATSWAPFMRHNWNDNNELAHWQKTYQHDRHSRILPLQYTLFGTDVNLVTRTGLNVAGPLPAQVTRVWKPANPKQVGSALMQWPCPTTTSK